MEGAKPQATVGAIHLDTDVPVSTGPHSIKNSTQQSISTGEKISRYTTHMDVHIHVYRCRLFLACYNVVYECSRLPLSGAVFAYHSIDIFNAKPLWIITVTNQSKHLHGHNREKGTTQLKRQQGASTGAHITKWSDGDNYVGSWVSLDDTVFR